MAVVENNFISRNFEMIETVMKKKCYNLCINFVFLVCYEKIRFVTEHGCFSEKF